MAEKAEHQTQAPPAYPAAVDPAMPTTYNTPPPTYTQPAPSTVNNSFLFSPDGIFIGVEGLMSFIIFVCAAADQWFAGWGGGGWVIFVGVTTFIIQIVLFLLHLLNVTEKMPSYLPLGLIEMGYTGTVSVLVFISACVASSKWAWSAAVRACTMFSFFGVIVYAADTVRRFLQMRSDNQLGLPTTSTRTTTTTTTVGGGSNITADPHY